MLHAEEFLTVSSRERPAPCRGQGEAPTTHMCRSRTEAMRREGRGSREARVR